MADAEIAIADLDALDPRDIAAFQARDAWLVQARSPKRRGRQIPPFGDDVTTVLYRAGRGFGKLLALDTPIPTPSGWTTMGEIAVGDQVFDEAGRTCRVTWASAPQSSLNAYRVAFSDRSTLDACADHQWVTWTHAERKAFLRSPYEDPTTFPHEWPRWRLRSVQGSRSLVDPECVGRALAMVRGGLSVSRAAAAIGATSAQLQRHVSAGQFVPPIVPTVAPGAPGPRIRTTAQIAATLTYGPRGDTNHCIPQTLPLDLPDAVLPVPAYTLGYWLGDGSSADGSITCHQDDQEHVRRLIGEDGFHTSDRGDPQQFGVIGLMRLLRGAGVLGNKHIPAPYLRASIVQRLALLRGLMDSDGGNDNANLVSFTSCVPVLADAVAELVVSLGMKVRRDDRVPTCTNNGVKGCRSYRIAFTPTVQIFNLPRKAARVKFDCGQLLRRHHRMITGVDLIDPTVMRCIAVDSPNSMYLAGRSMIPTHNTKALTEFSWWELWRQPRLICHAIAPTIADVKGTLFEGPAGFLNVIPHECLRGGSQAKAYNRSTRELYLSNGSLVRGFGAQEEAGRLRGPQCHLLIGDELREWERPAGNLEQAINNALFGLRLPLPDGTPARALFGTTPRPVPFLKRFERRPGVRVVTGTSYENLENLSPTFRSQLLALDGTLFGKQEIEAAYIDEEADLAIFKRSWIKLWPAERRLPEFVFVLESYDCASSEENYNSRRQETDPTASIVLGIFNVHKEIPDAAERARLGIRSRYAALLCEAWSQRLGTPDLLERAKSQHRIKWGTPGKHADVVLIENKSSGIALRQFLNQWGVPSWPYNPGMANKTTRAHAQSPLVKQGLLWVPESTRPDRRGMARDWCEPFLEQICGFAGPGSVEHDDYVDSLVQALDYCKHRGLLSALPAETNPDRDEVAAREKAEAERESQKDRRRRFVNPYG